MLESAVKPAQYGMDVFEFDGMKAPFVRPTVTSAARLHLSWVAWWVAWIASEPLVTPALEDELVVLHAYS